MSQNGFSLYEKNACPLSIVGTCHVELEMSSAVPAGGRALFGSLEISAAGVIFDSIFGKPSVCTREDKLWRGLKCCRRSAVIILSLEVASKPWVSSASC